MRYRPQFCISFMFLQLQSRGIGEQIIVMGASSESLDLNVSITELGSMNLMLRQLKFRATGESIPVALHHRVSTFVVSVMP